MFLMPVVTAVLRTLNVSENRRLTFMARLASPLDTFPGTDVTKETIRAMAALVAGLTRSRLVLVEGEHPHGLSYVRGGSDHLWCRVTLRR